VAAPVFGAVARQLLLYLGVRPEREPLVTWPGQMMLAATNAPAKPPAPPPAVEDSFPDTEDPPEPVVQPLQQPSPDTESEHSSTTRGGRSHASF
jgi:hypothetical protein